MRSPRLTSSLFGSLGVHGGLLLWGLFGSHLARPVPVLPDAWLGNSVEVDTAPTVAAEKALSGEPIVSKPAAAAIAATPAPVAAPAALQALAPRARTARPAPANAEAGTPAASAEPSPRPIGAFGSEGLPAGVRNLPSAFTRAITRAASLDPVWRSLPAGSAGDFTVAVAVDEPGHIASAALELPSRTALVPPELTRLKERVVALLGGGQFALSGGTGAGVDRLHIRITLSDGVASEEGNPEDVLELGFDPPRSGNVGRAHFRLASGRRFEAIVVVLPSGR